MSNMVNQKYYFEEKKKPLNRRERSHQKYQSQIFHTIIFSISINIFAASGDLSASSMDVCMDILEQWAVESTVVKGLDSGSTRADSLFSRYRWVAKSSRFDFQLVRSSSISCDKSSFKFWD